MDDLVLVAIAAFIIVLLIVLINKTCNNASGPIVENIPRMDTPKSKGPYNLCRACKEKGIKVEKGLNVIYNDGGSIKCNDCKQAYHACKGGQERYGSPGPLMCEICHPCK